MNMHWTSFAVGAIAALIVYGFWNNRRFGTFDAGNQYGPASGASYV